jgi:hypothetical protein
MFDYVSDVEDGAIVGWDFCISRHEEMSPCSAFGFWLAQVASVAMDRHLLVWHSSKAVGWYVPVFLWLGWLLATQWCLWVLGLCCRRSSVEEELAAYFLDEFLLRGVDEGSRGVLYGILYVGSIFDCGVGEWLIWLLRSCVLEELECLLYISRHV